MLTIYSKKCKYSKGEAAIETVLKKLNIEYDSTFYDKTSLYEENKVVPTIEKLKEKGSSESICFPENSKIWEKE